MDQTLSWSLAMLVLAIFAAFISHVAWRNGICDGYDYACRRHDPLFEQNGVCDILRQNGRDLSSDANTPAYIDQLITTNRRMAQTIADLERKLVEVPRA